MHQQEHLTPSILKSVLASMFLYNHQAVKAAFYAQLLQGDSNEHIEAKGMVLAEDDAGLHPAKKAKAKCKKVIHLEDNSPTTPNSPADPADPRNAGGASVDAAEHRPHGARSEASQPAAKQRQRKARQAMGSSSMWNERTTSFGDMMITFREDQQVYTARCPLHSYFENKHFRCSRSITCRGGDAALHHKALCRLKWWCHQGICFICFFQCFDGALMPMPCHVGFSIDTSLEKEAKRKRHMSLKDNKTLLNQQLQHFLSV